MPRKTASHKSSRQSSVFSRQHAHFFATFAGVFAAFAIKSFAQQIVRLLLCGNNPTTIAGRFPNQSSVPSPAKFAAFGNIRPALLGIVLRQGFVANLALRTVTANTFWAHSRIVNSTGLPMFTGRLRRSGQPHESVDLIADVAEASGLVAVAVNRQVFAQQSLLHEIGNHSSVIHLHARPIGIEDADNARVHFVIAVEGHVSASVNRLASS